MTRTPHWIFSMVGHNDGNGLVQAILKHIGSKNNQLSRFMSRFASISLKSKSLYKAFYCQLMVWFRARNQIKGLRSREKMSLLELRQIFVKCISPFFPEVSGKAYSNSRLTVQQLNQMCMTVLDRDEEAAASVP